MSMCEETAARLVALWCARFGGPPPVLGDEQFMLELIADETARPAEELEAPYNAVASIHVAGELTF